VGLKDVFQSRGRRDIVVCVPRAKRDEVAAEEADVAAREAAGETGIEYYWAMGRLPKEDPGRVYFVEDGSLTSWHEVTRVDRAEGRIYMSTRINRLEQPVPTAPFRGFRYYRGER
jgi:hypothetical protein